MEPQCSELTEKELKKTLKQTAKKFLNNLVSIQKSSFYFWDYTYREVSKIKLLILVAFRYKLLVIEATIQKLLVLGASGIKASSFGSSQQKSFVRPIPLHSMLHNHHPPELQWQAIISLQLRRLSILINIKLFSMDTHTWKSREAVN